MHVIERAWGWLKMWQRLQAPWLSMAGQAEQNADADAPIGKFNPSQYYEARSA